MVIATRVLSFFGSASKIFKLQALISVESYSKVCGSAAGGSASGRVLSDPKFSVQIFRLGQTVLPSLKEG